VGSTIALRCKDLCMKVTVLHPPPLDPADTTPPPGRVLRFQGDSDGFTVDSDARRPWPAARFLTLYRPKTGDGPRLLLLIDGRRRPLELSAATLGGPLFAALGGDCKQLARAIVRQAPRVMLDRATYDALRGAPTAPLPADPRIYAAALQRALLHAQPKDTSPVVSQRVSDPRAAPLAAAGANDDVARCPHCDHPRDAGKQKCERCGIVFAKLERVAREVGDQALMAPEGDLEPALGSGINALHAAGSDPAASRLGETFLSADSVAATVIGLVHAHGVSLMLLALCAIVPWCLLTLGLLVVGRPSVWRTLAIFVFSTIAYVHTVSSITYALHQVAQGRAWSPGAAFKAASRRLLTLVPGRLLALMPMLLGLVAFALPGFVFALRSVFLEVVGTAEQDPPQGISWNQVSSNLSDGFRYTLAAQLGLTTLLLLAMALIPAGVVKIATLLGLLDGAIWLAPSLATVLAALLWAAAALVLWTMVLYVLYRELQDRQGIAMWNSPSGLSLLAKVVLLIDFFLLLAFLVLASRLRA